MNNIEILENMRDNIYGEMQFEDDYQVSELEEKEFHALNSAITALKERQADKDRIKELEEQVKMLDEAYTGAIKESKKWFNIAHQSIPKSLVKEKIEWLEDNILDNEYASGSDMDIAEYQIDILKRILGEKQ